MRTIFIFILSTLCACAQAAPNFREPPESQQVKSLVAQYLEADEACNGSSNPETSSTCKKRSKIGGELNKIGWCYGSNDPAAATYQMDWGLCEYTASSDDMVDAMTAYRTPPKVNIETMFKNENRSRYCLSVMNLLSIAAQGRESGVSPKNILDNINVVALKNVSVEERKKYINDAYFDPKINTIPSDAIYSDTLDRACLSYWKPVHDWKPLK